MSTDWQQFLAEGGVKRGRETYNENVNTTLETGGED
jgi:hypothetical protein